MLRSRLLPNTEDPYDLSAFSGAGGKETEYRIPKWIGVNTDQARLAYVDARILPQANLPYLRGGGLRRMDYIEEIVDGFAEMYRFFMSKRTALAGRRGRLRELHNLSNRILFRRPCDYIAILNRLHLRICAIRPRADQIDPLPERFRAVIEAERAALQQLDVPYFPGRTNINRAIARINAMGVRGLRRETRVMKTALLLKMLQQQTP